MKSLLFSAVLIGMFSITSPALTNSALLTAKESAMPRRPVRSSNIASIGYDAASQTLEVEFVTRSVYQYYNVPPSVYEGLMDARSHGAYLAKYVKGVYRYREVL